jgi:tetratricopeptide (TPR) repeat protein
MFVASSGRTKEKKTKAKVSQPEQVFLYNYTRVQMAEKNVNNVADGLFIIWLDSNIEKTRKDQDTRALIRRMVRGRLLTFDKPNECVDHIFAKLKTQRIFFIVSNSFGPNVVPLIHDLPQIQTIYVYCRDRKYAESWSKSYKKISNIFTEKQAILHKILDDVGTLDQDGDIPMSIFHLEERQNSLQNLTDESARFMWYQSILVVLRLMAKYGNSKTEMIAECRANYHNDKSEEKKINDFEKSYTPSKAFYWYTTDSFVYRLLNQALRTQSIEIIFKFRFFINDLHNQIKELYRKYLLTHPHTKTHLTLYRGQRITMTELESLKNNVNQLISMNSFLSATTIRDIAEIFADTSDQHNQTSPLQSVLFIIDVADITKDTTPFAFIEDYSCFADEEEVLFTIGAIFKVKSVIKDKDKKTWHVHLQLNKREDEVSQDVQNYMKKHIGSEPGPTTFGWFLYRMNEFDKAERYIKLLIEELPPNDKERGNAYNLLGLMYKDLRKLSDSVESYEKALAIYSNSSSPNSCQVIAIHCNLALAYLALNDERTADEHQQEAEEKLSKSLYKTEPLLIALTSTLKGKIQIAKGDYKSAYKNIDAALQRKKAELPANHPSLASTLNDMGIVQENLGDITKALAYFTQALEIRQKSLPPDHLDIAECFTNIGRIHEKNKQPALASKQYKLASKIAMNDMRE